MGDKFAIAADAGWQRCIDKLVATYQGVDCSTIKTTETPETLKDQPAEPKPEEVAKKQEDAAALSRARAEEFREKVLKPKE